MNKFFAFVLTLTVFFGSFTLVRADVWVNGYTKSNGTYVNGYYRSSPDSNPYNNYSYPGNTNPYTGKTASGNPDTYLDNYYNSSSNYSAPSSYYSPPTPTCPLNSYSDGSSCKCNYGYSVSGGSCVSNDSQCHSQIGYSSSYDSSNNTCKCNRNYVIGTSGQCTSASLVCSSQIGIMSQYNNSTKKCECMSGYEFNGTTCEYENSNYGAYTTIDSNTCPANSTLKQSDSTCYCNMGYSTNSSKTGCVVSSTTLKCPMGNICTPDPTAPKVGDCPQGYLCVPTPQKSNDTSMSFTRDLKTGDSGEDVIRLQGYLQEQGVLTIPGGIKAGYFGSITKEAVKRFQQKNNLVVTGKFETGMKLLLNK